MKVLIYTKTTCPYCVMAKDWFNRAGIEFDEVNFSENPEKLTEFKEQYPNAKTVPQIFIDDELIGGYTDLEAVAKDIISRFTSGI